MITKKLIESILKSAQKHNKAITADYVYCILKDVEEIKANVLNIEREREAEQKKIETKLKEINCRLKKMQDQCGHLSSTYHPDPSGNNDSYYVCDICNKTL